MDDYYYKYFATLFLMKERIKVESGIKCRRCEILVAWGERGTNVTPGNGIGRKTVRGEDGLKIQTGCGRDRWKQEN